MIVCSTISLFDGIIVVGLRFLDVLPQNGDPMLLVILVGMGIFGASILVIQGIIGASVIADVLDDHELRTHYRQEAMFNAALSFSGKAISSIGIVLGGLILSMIDLPRGVAPADVPHGDDHAPRSGGWDLHSAVAPDSAQPDHALQDHASGARRDPSRTR